MVKDDCKQRDIDIHQATVMTQHPSIHPSIIYLSKTSKHINIANQFKNTHNIGFDAKVHVGLFNRLHVTHKNNTKVEMIYNHITPKYTHAQTCETFKKI